jgi:glycosyltransferase involved in cell wall biosynthesis
MRRAARRHGRTVGSARARIPLVLHVIQGPEGGGPAQALALARDGLARGGRVLVACSGDATAVEAQLGDRVVRLTNDFVRTLQLLRLGRRADLVHVHGTRAAAWSFPTLGLRPSIVTFHGLHPLRRPASTVRRAAGLGFVGATIRVADAVVCVSNADGELLRAHGLGHANVRVIRNGVLAEPPPTAEERGRARSALGLADDVLAVLFLGRLAPAKNPLEAVRVAAGLQDEGVILLVAGDGELVECVRQAATPNVFVLGHSDDTRALLSAADVLLSTSVWEGLPLALLEAMAAERPVVCSDTAGNVEAVGPGGLVVRQGDLDGYRAALRRLTDARERRRLGHAGGERVRREFTLDGMVTETNALYAHVLGREPW